MYARRFANRGRAAEQLLALMHTAYRQAGTAFLVFDPSARTVVGQGTV